MVEYSAFNRFVPGSNPGQSINYRKLNKHKFHYIEDKKIYTLFQLIITKTTICNYPQGNSNPRYLREREMS